MTTIEDQVTIRRYDSSTASYVDDERYTVFWIEQGIEAISIDQHRFSVHANSAFFVTRGVPVRIDYGANPKGWILAFSDTIFRDTAQRLAIRDAEIFSTFGQVPRVILSPRIGARVASIAEMIDELVGSRLPHRETAITALLRTLLIYCDSNCNVRMDGAEETAKVQIVTRYKDLVAERYTETHQTSDYACMLNITPQYLNQATNEILGVTAKDIIHEQLTVEARHALKFSDDSIKRIALKLGFSDPHYFSKYFKKHVGCTPSEYRLQ
jgi:AraC-like DNA-binding protein